jgi:adenylosuccinate synthase
VAVTVVVGGQFGSEGKGKVAQFLAKDGGAHAVVRVGGPNSGHTGIDAQGLPQILRQLPTAALLPDVLCVIGPGSYLSLDLLEEEIRATGLNPDRLLVDRNAVIVTESDRRKEAESGLTQRIGSTGTGTGAAVARRALRSEDVRLAIDVPRLAPVVADTPLVLRQILRGEGRIVVEGTQGFGLSVLHSPHYPFATSRDTSAAGAVSEAGLSPRDVDDVVLVIRANPIRVAGNSGPLPNETEWETIAHSAGHDSPIEERTSVTRKVRRVAEFDPAIVRAAIAVNDPSTIVLNHVDHIDAECRSVRTLTGEAREFVARVAAEIGAPIRFVGFSPNPELAEMTSPRYAVMAAP